MLSALKSEWQEMDWSTRLAILAALIIVPLLMLSPAWAEPDLTRTRNCAIQGRLTALGYYKRNLTCKYGPYTQDAITFYQADQGMVPTGHVGPRTFRALFGCSRSDKPCMLKQTKACSQELTDKCYR